MKPIPVISYPLIQFQRMHCQLQWTHRDCHWLLPSLAEIWQSVRRDEPK